MTFSSRLKEAEVLDALSDSSVSHKWLVEPQQVLWGFLAESLIGKLQILMADVAIPLKNSLQSGVLYLVIHVPDQSSFLCLQQYVC